jgi:hypothetical protein
MTGRTYSLGTSRSPIAIQTTVERKRQRIKLAFQSMKDSAKFINLDKCCLDQRCGLLSAVVDPDNEVLFKLAQRCGDIPVAPRSGIPEPGCAAAVRRRESLRVSVFRSRSIR